MTSSSGKYFVQSGTSNFGFSGGNPGIQSVTRRRAGYFPVNSAARVGEHTVQAEYACVNFIPSRASRSMCGVSYKSLP